MVAANFSVLIFRAHGQLARVASVRFVRFIETKARWILLNLRGEQSVLAELAACLINLSSNLRNVLNTKRIVPRFLARRGNIRRFHEQPSNSPPIANLSSGRVVRWKQGFFANLSRVPRWANARSIAGEASPHVVANTAVPIWTLIIERL